MERLSAASCAPDAARSRAVPCVASQRSPATSELPCSAQCSIGTPTELQWSFVGGSRAPMHRSPTLPVLHRNTRQQLDEAFGAAMDY